MSRYTLRVVRQLRGVRTSAWAVVSALALALAAAAAAPADGPPLRRAEAVPPSRPVAAPPRARADVVLPQSARSSDAQSGASPHVQSNGDVATVEPSPQPERAGRDPRSVFFIQRNKNRNEVHYGIRLDEQCRPAGDDPVHNYWLRLEEGPNVTKPVQLFQQAGYGIARQTVADSGVEIVLRALDDRTIAVVPSRGRAGCTAEAFVTIAGARARFDKAYVFAEDGLILPRVKYVELFGAAPDGTAVRERIDVR